MCDGQSDRTSPALVEDREGVVDVTGKGFGFSKHNLQQSIQSQDILLAQKFDAATHGLGPGAGFAAFSSSQPLEKTPPWSPRKEIVLTGQPGKFDGVDCGARLITTHQRKRGRVQFPECASADMGEVRDPPLGVADEGGHGPMSRSGHNVSAR
jgi:hypothetical protein